MRWLLVFCGVYEGYRQNWSYDGSSLFGFHAKRCRVPEGDNRQLQSCRPQRLIVPILYFSHFGDTIRIGGGPILRPGCIRGVMPIIGKQGDCKIVRHSLHLHLHNGDCAVFGSQGKCRTDQICDQQRCYRWPQIFSLALAGCRAATIISRLVSCAPTAGSDHSTRQPLVLSAE
jgi:hypothetical protein